MPFPLPLDDFGYFALISFVESHLSGLPSIGKDNIGYVIKLPDV